MEILYRDSLQLRCTYSASIENKFSWSEYATEKGCSWEKHRLAVSLQAYGGCKVGLYRLSHFPAQGAMLNNKLSPEHDKNGLRLVDGA